MALTALGNASYNGWTFSPKMELVGLQGTPVPDAAGRTIVYVRWMIRILDRVAANPGGTLDATIATARQQLLVPGGALTLNGKGFGDLSVNGNNARKDVNFGPKILDFEYKVTGRDGAADLIWACEVATPESCANPAYSFRLMESVYSVSYQRDFSGYTTRTVSGYIRVPLTRSSVTSRTLSDNADNYRQLVMPITPVGFRPGNQSWTLDESKTKATYSFSDVEMPPNMPPPGVIEVRASHVVQTQRAGISTSSWSGTLSASYEVAKDVSRSLAWTYFVQLLASRITAALQNASEAGTLLIRHLSLAEPDIHGKLAAAFSASYTFSTTLDTILAASGLWTPVPNSDYAQWRASLSSGIFSADGRSYAGLKFDPNADVIVDLCSTNVNVLTAGGILNQNQLVAGGFLQNPYPAPAGSFLDFALNARLEIDDNVAEMKALPNNPFAAGNPDLNAPLNNPGPGQPIGPGGAPAGQIINQVAGFTPPFAPGQQLNNPQQRVAPDMAIILEGRAIRAGYPISPPMLTQINGVTPVQANREGEHFFTQGQMANWFGVPIIGAVWRLRWTLPQVPAGPIGVPPNPM